MLTYESYSVPSNTSCPCEKWLADQHRFRPISWKKVLWCIGGQSTLCLKYRPYLYFSLYSSQIKNFNSWTCLENLIQSFLCFFLLLHVSSQPQAASYSEFGHCFVIWCNRRLTVNEASHSTDISMQSEAVLCRLEHLLGRVTPGLTCVCFAIAYLHRESHYNPKFKYWWRYCYDRNCEPSHYTGLTFPRNYACLKGKRYDPFIRFRLSRQWI